MDYRLLGSVDEDAKLLVVDESSYTVQVDMIVSAGAFEIGGLTNTQKVVTARRLSNGEVLGYGSVTPALGTVGGSDLDTVLLIHSYKTTDGSQTFLDSASGGNAPHIITAFGDCQHSLDQQKFGRTGIKFGGDSADYLSAAYDVDYNFYGVFTVDYWVYHNSSPTAYEAHIQRYWTGQDWPYWKRTWMFRRDPNGKLNVLIGSPYNAPWISTVSTEIITSNVWHHIAVVKDSGSFVKAYLDGTELVLNPPIQQLYHLARDIPVIIGAEYTNQGFGPRPYGSPLDGYMDEIRVSPVARWTSDFTPETGIYTA